MLGTLVKEKTAIEKKYEKSCEVVTLLRKMGNEHRGYLRSKYAIREIIKDRKQLKRCVELAKEFKIVEIDKTCERRIKTKTGEVITCQLVFSVNLPLHTVTTKRVKGKNGNEYELKTQTPLPTKEVLNAIKIHRGKFDKVALWWVPNEIICDEVKDLDPMLVGSIRTNNHGDIHFELVRWIDENYEAEYWTKEGY